MNERISTTRYWTTAPVCFRTRYGALQAKWTRTDSLGIAQSPVASGSRVLNLQRRSTGQAESSTVPPIMHEVLSSPRRPLDPATLALMEPRFGHDFGRVQVYATRAAKDVWSESRPASFFAMPATVFAKLPAALQSAAHETRLPSAGSSHLARGAITTGPTMGQVPAMDLRAAAPSRAAGAPARASLGSGAA
jgi:hypothetical protein